MPHQRKDAIAEERKFVGVVDEAQRGARAALVGDLDEIVDDLLWRSDQRIAARPTREPLPITFIGPRGRANWRIAPYRRMSTAS